MALWTQPVDSRDDAEVAFREVYADPAVVNGTEMTIAELARRARSRQRAFGQLGVGREAGAGGDVSRAARGPGA